MKSKAVLFFFLLIVTISNINAQNKGYKRGYLILDNNRILNGYVKYSVGSWSIWKSKPSKVKFKFTPESTPIKAKDDVKGFVIESDSFTIKYNITINNSAPVFERDFVKVIEVGKINLYLHQCTSTTSTGIGIGPIGLNMVNGHGTWILSKGAQNLNLYKIKRQKERLIHLISDNEELASEVKNKKPSDLDIQDIVSRYNSGG